MPCPLVSMAAAVDVHEGVLEFVGGRLKVLNQALGINNILWILQQMVGKTVHEVGPRVWVVVSGT